MENHSSDFETDDYSELASSWSNWSTPAAAVLYSAMSSVLAVTNHTPLPDFGQDLAQSTGLISSTGSSFNHSQTLSTDLPSIGLDADKDAAAAMETAGSFAFVVPWWRQVLWSILFGGMVIVATGGNLIVVWIVMTTKRMRTVTNYFIVNLSIADAMVSSLNVTFNYYYMLDNDWPFGEFYCKLSQFIAMLSICASVFTLMAISIDRYVAIIRPLQPRMSKRCNLAIAAAIWLASTLISCPMMIFYRTEEVPVKGHSPRTVCFPEWPDGPTNHSTLESIFRYGFKMVFRWCLFVRVGTEPFSRRENLTSRYSCSGSPDHNRIKRNDTQKSILYTCPSSPKSHRISHCGTPRNATLRNSQQPENQSGRKRMSYQQELQQRWPGQGPATANAGSNSNSNTTQLLS
ncbi:tachykinin-like peptides receptor 99D isoform X2 [Drosophila serrata]|uniref:tachykinin-like peptides receptor 99D isoform X2 n=1 Tax=Drosophila serrata TaxID=7274 RepID=UPI000A1CF55F|nr:tachykinin-like peptides receptor 99D isoform X2 [Drosophila serrata]